MEAEDETMWADIEMIGLNVYRKKEIVYVAVLGTCVDYSVLKFSLIFQLSNATSCRARESARPV